MTCMYMAKEKEKWVLVLILFQDVDFKLSALVYMII